MLHQIVEYIGIDLLETFKVMPMICLYALPFTLFYALFAYILIDNKVRCVYKIISAYVLYVYIFVVIYITLLSREPGSRIGVDLRIFGTFYNDSLSMTYVVENLLMMMPLGILLPLNFDRLRSGYRQVLVALICSFLIEMCQYFTERGFLQTDDIWLNVAGCFIVSALYNSIRNYFLTKRSNDCRLELQTRSKASRPQ